MAARGARRLTLGARRRVTTLGQIMVWLAAGLAGWAAVIGVMGLRDGAALRESATRAVPALATVLTIAMYCLAVALHRRDMNVGFVADTTSRALPTVYRDLALVAAPVGALLVFLGAASWLTVLALRRAGPPDGAVRAVCSAAVGVCALLLLAVVVSRVPFTRLPYTPVDGAGLPAGLADRAFVVYTPLVVVGAACTMPAFVLSVAGKIARRWMAIAFASLSAALTVGAWWTYRTPMWSGDAAWMPLHDALVLPWAVAGLCLAITNRVPQRLRGALSGLPFGLALVALFALSDAHAPRSMAFGLGASGLVVLLLGLVVSVAPAIVRRSAASAPADASGLGRLGAITCGVGLLALLVSGALGLGAQRARTVTLGTGDTVQVAGIGGRWTLRQLDVSTFVEYDRAVSGASAILWHGGQRRGVVTTERRQVLDVSGRPLGPIVTTATVRSTPFADFWLTLRDVGDGHAQYQVRVVPFVWLARVGSVLLVVGAVMVAVGLKEELPDR